MSKAIVTLFIVVLQGATQDDAREWTDSKGHYQVEADLIAYDADEVVLEKPGGELISMPIDQLSEADKNYLKSKDAEASVRKSAEETQEWTMRNGLKVVGRMVDYAERDITIQQHLGKIYVEDKAFDNLPQIYQKLLPLIVAELDKTTIKDKSDFELWASRQGGKPRTFHCEGVLLELESGDRYGLPFSFFSDADREMLKPGWDRWLAAKENHTQKEQESFYLRSQAQAYNEQLNKMNQVAQLQLQVQAYDAGLFDLWEVAMSPRGAGMPLSVVVPARNSQQAATAALEQYPNYVVGPIAKVRRKR